MGWSICPSTWLFYVFPFVCVYICIYDKFSPHVVFSVSIGRLTPSFPQGSTLEPEDTRKVTSANNTDRFLTTGEIVSAVGRCRVRQGVMPELLDPCWDGRTFRRCPVLEKFFMWLPSFIFNFRALFSFLEIRETKVTIPESHKGGRHWYEDMLQDALKILLVTLLSAPHPWAL